MSVARRVRRWVRALLALTVCASAAVGRADAQLYFGQNLVQYDRLDWRVIETEHFLVHYYPAERRAAVDAAQIGRAHV